MRRIAGYLGYSGSYAAARDMLARIAIAFEQADDYDPDHPDTLETRHNLAHWTGQAGDAASARDQLAALLPDKERVLGPDHPDTLTTRTNLEYWTGKAGPAG